MALASISFIASNYSDYADWWLKAYTPGTTTPITMSLDSEGDTTVAKLEINVDGFIVTAGDALVIPYIDGAYDLWLFPTEAEADANDTSNALRLADDIIGGGGGSGGTAGFADVAAMVLTSPESGVGLQTVNYIVGDKGGGALYLCKTAAEATTDGDTIDELSNHTLANGNVAILQYDGEVDFRVCGGRVYDVASPFDNAAALLAADAQGFTIRIVGIFFFLTAVDLGLGSTNVRTQILGVENTNVDGDGSAFYFDGTAGITVNAGAKIHDIDIKNIGTKAGSGTGLVVNNVHSGSIKDITSAGFERGYYIFAFQSALENLTGYQCTTAFEFYDECTSLTVKNCWGREGTTGFLLGPSITYSSFLNCAVDDCDVPYSVAGNNVDFNNCGAEIGHDSIEGFFNWNSSSGGASTVTISGGRFIMLNGETTNSCLYSTAAASNESSVVVVSRMTSNSFTGPVDGFISGKLRAFCSDSCSFADSFNLAVTEGDFGSIMMDGRSSGTLRRYAKKTPKIGCSQDDTDAKDDMLAIIIEEVVDFQQVITDTEEVFIKFAGTDAGSHFQFKVEMFPLTATGNYSEFAGWNYGSSTGKGLDIVGTPFGFKGNDANGYQNWYFDRTEIQELAMVRVTATGWPDNGFRDVLCTLTVGPDDA